MFKKILLMILGFSMMAGGIWALRAQDPAPQKTTKMRSEPQTATAQTTQTDLSGTYTGTFNCDELGLTGDTTLTINGNEFTTADGKTGRIVASTTGGYTAVALQVGGTTTTTPAAAPGATAMEPPKIVSLRARKVGNRLTLMSVPGAMMKCTFTSGRNTARNRRNRTTPATGTEVSTPAAVPTESPMPEQSPSPTPTPRRGRPRPSPSPSASPTPSPEPMPTPTPSPEPVPSPSPEPVPSPTPGEPTPSPSPGPSPSPSPTPSPSPRPRG